MFYALVLLRLVVTRPFVVQLRIAAGRRLYLFAILVRRNAVCFFVYGAQPAAVAIAGSMRDVFDRFEGSGQQVPGFFHTQMFLVLVNGKPVYLLEAVVQLVAVDAHFHSNTLDGNVADRIFGK